MAILKAAQIIKYSPASKDYPTGAFCESIAKWEKAAFRNCLGTKFLDLLEADMVDNSEAEKWDEDKEYENDDIVLYQGLFFQYKFIKNVDGIDFPNCSVNWTEAKVFASDCYNDIWEELASYLSIFIYNRSLPFVHYANGATGLQIQKSDNNGGEAVNERELVNYRKALECECSESLDTLKEKIRTKHNKGCDFAFVEFIDDECNNCKNESSQSATRFMFRY